LSGERHRANFRRLHSLRLVTSMPTYEYRCPEGHEFEQFVLKISAAKSELTCPTCGLVAPRRMSAGGGLVFKGSGFYITDYGKDGKKAQPTAAAAPAPASGTESKGSEGKSASTESKGDKGAAGVSSSTGDRPAKSESAEKSAKPATPTSAPKPGPAK
jgi:putative FmdB family regulatory protein